MGKDKNKGVRLEGFTPEVVELGDNFSKDDLWIHDENDKVKAYILSRFFDQPQTDGEGELRFPRPFGVLYADDRPTYDEGVNAQVEYAKVHHGDADLDVLLRGKETWVVK